MQISNLKRLLEACTFGLTKLILSFEKNNLFWKLRFWIFISKNIWKKNFKQIILTIH